MTKPRDEFLDLLTTACENAELVAQILRARGLTIKVLEHSVSPNVEQRWNHVDDGDLEITETDGTIRRIELKHWPSVEFHSIESIPYLDVIVDEAYKIDKARRRSLHSYMIINASRSAYLLIPENTKRHWFKKTAVDGRESDPRVYYFCPKHFLSVEKLTDTTVAELTTVEKILPTTLAAAALCGSLFCGGCYEVGDGKSIHSPRAGYDQSSE